MTEYERADRERKQFWDRKMLVKEQMKSITDPEELAQQKERYRILDAMYRETLLRMEALRAPSEKKRRAPKNRLTALYRDDVLESGVACRGEAKDGAVANLFGTTVRWDELDADNDDPRKVRMMRAFKRAGVVCTPRQQEILSLHLQGKSVTEIGEILGVDKSTVSVTLDRAKAHIQKVEADMEIKDKTINRSHNYIDLSNPDLARRALSAMTETQAVYLYLYYGEWLSMRDIERLLGRDKSTVSRTLRRAAGRIQTIFEHETGAGITLLGIDALEPILYEIYQQHSADDLIPERAKRAACQANAEHYRKRAAYPEHRDKFLIDRLYAQEGTRTLERSRLLSALQEAAAKRMKSVLDLLCGLMKRFLRVKKGAISNG